jgi:hypothetical protein
MKCTVSIICHKTNKMTKVLYVTADTYKLCEEKVIKLNKKNKNKIYKITEINS